ncbi:hypothetical protein BDR03DRAFT_971551 [Suillus americanus]|nr:hypothetical protein BDR03DRAFT_971551 [Suillus americanus]
MKFTSLTTVIITTAAMAGVVIASAAGLPYIPCSPDQGGCSMGIGDYNNGNAFGYLCGANGVIRAWFPCSCNTPSCCEVYALPDGNFRSQCVAP